jgi:hypothetical protein
MLTFFILSGDTGFHGWSTLPLNLYLLCIYTFALDIYTKLF